MNSGRIFHLGLHDLLIHRVAATNKQLCPCRKCDSDIMLCSCVNDGSLYRCVAEAVLGKEVF